MYVPRGWDSFLEGTERDLEELPRCNSQKGLFSVLALSMSRICPHMARLTVHWSWWSLIWSEGQSSGMTPCCGELRKIHYSQNVMMDLGAHHDRIVHLSKLFIAAAAAQGASWKLRCILGSFITENIEKSKQPGTRARAEGCSCDLLMEEMKAWNSQDLTVAPWNCLVMICVLYIGNRL